MTIWTHGTDTLESFLGYFNQIDSIGQIKFTKQVKDEDGIEFLDLTLKFENSEIAVDVFAKVPTVSHMCYLLVFSLVKISIIYHMI